MKEQVADMSKVLQDMTVEMWLMRETINQQYAEIAKLNRNIEALNRQIRKKDETIAKLKNSCTFRSDFGADAFLELHSIVETVKKHNKTPFNAIQALFEV